MLRLAFLAVLPSLMNAAAILISGAEATWQIDDGVDPPIIGSCSDRGTSQASCSGPTASAMAFAEFGHIGFFAGTDRDTGIQRSTAAAGATFEDALTFLGAWTNAFLMIEVTPDIFATCFVGEIQFDMCELTDENAMLRLIPVTKAVPISISAGIGGVAGGSQDKTGQEGVISFLKFTIVDENRNPLRGISLRSESGTQYTLDEANMLPIPEPSSLTLLGLAIGVILGHRALVNNGWRH